MDNSTINDLNTMSGGGESLLADRYRVVRQLGQGGMGSVWLAEDTALDGHLVAIKMLPAILVANKRAFRQLKSEALVSMRLVHPNIVQVRSFEENNGNPFLVSDYIEGQTLDDLLAEKETLSEEEVIRLLRPVADALDYAHAEGVVHRDVKPANVIIRSDGRPFVLDFGIAREIQETMTRVTGRLSSGTLMYMSPEQLNGASPKPAQDVYSFAAMVYECLSGQPPFCRGQIEYQILNNPPLPLDAKFANCGSVVAGLAKTSAERPASCAAVLEWEPVDGEFARAGAPDAKDLSLKEEVSSHLGPKAGDIKTVTLPGGAELKLVYCPPGTFMMGSPPSEEGRYDGEVQHLVTLTKGFWIGKYEVTQRQWRSVMGNNPSIFEGDDRPVENVSWEDCQEFLVKAGNGLRLPTEAEWEYACRAGSSGPYAGTGHLGDMGWFDGNTYGRTHNVGMKNPNAWGIYDMHGNVWEWCLDWYGAYERDTTDPTGPSSGSDRVYRGGSRDDYARDCRSAGRGGNSPGIRSIDLGFRVALAPSH